MDIEPIRQLNLGDISAQRFGDVLTTNLIESDHSRFRFAVAYMRKSGLGRLRNSIDSFKEDGGTVAGAVGVGGRITGRDTGVTSEEALETLAEIAPESTVFTTTTDVIFHPKVYIFRSESVGEILVGSANVTRDGLYRNVEFGSHLHFDLTDGHDLEVFEQHEDFVMELLDSSNPNVQPVNDDVISHLRDDGIIQSESDMPEPSTSAEPEGQTTLPESSISDQTREMFPSLEVEAPPARETSSSEVPGVDQAQTFIVQLSDFDTSHRSDTPGTSEILIPKGALAFFPELTEEGDTNPDDSYFDVIIPTVDGEEEYTARLWHYEDREEYRLRVKPEMIDLTTRGGGDLLVVEILPEDPVLEYHLSLVQEEDDEFEELFGQCTHIASGGKRWGFMQS